MSSLTRSKPSFIIYRDEPAADGQTQQSTNQPTTTSTSSRLTISTSASLTVSLEDKENAAPYSAVDKSGKQKAPKLTRSLSAPTSPVLPSDGEGAKAIRQALATKFVAATTKSSKSKSSSTEPSATKAKSKSKSSSSSKRAVTTATSSSSDATATSTTAPKLKRSNTSPSPSSSQKKKPTRKPSLLAPLPEEGSGVVAEDPTTCGPDGLTIADRRARDLTQLPLGDISEAFPTSPMPEGFTNIVAAVSRKRTRAHSINARDDQPTSVTVEVPSLSSQLLGVEGGPSSSQTTAVVSNTSPHKRVRLSPLVESAQLPSISPLATPVDLPVLSTQETTVEDLKDELDVEATLIDFSMEGGAASS